MAEGDGVIYNEFKEKVMEGKYNLASGGDALKVALHTDSYVPDIDADVQQSLLGNECSGTGYTAGGEALAGQDVTKDTGNDRGKFDANDLTWTSLGPLTPDPKWAVLYRAVASPNDLVIAYWDVGTTHPNGGNWTLQWGANGIILLT